MEEKAPSKASILGALSQALDLVEGQPEGHALRTSLISLRIAEVLCMNEEQREDLYFASVLKDSGCSNNAVRIQKIFGGDDFLHKYKVKFIDWTSPAEGILFCLKNTEVGNSLGAKLRRLAANVGPPLAIMREVTEARCTRGAFIAQKLNFRIDVAKTIMQLDEHWDGKGAPVGSSGTNIHPAARILCLAQSFEVFCTAYGLEAASAMVRKRAKKWFDPEVVRACLSIDSQDQLWKDLQSDDLNATVTAKVPWLGESAIDTDIDGICEAFAMIIDAKSSFTSEHSTRVTDYSLALGRYFAFDSERLQTLRRACLMHDVGKLGVSTNILEKPGKLDNDEFDRVKLHPKFSDMILRRIPTFDKIAEIASAHHERLDGRGYWRGLTGEQLALDVRITTVCDVFDALTANRPYRDAMPYEQAMSILDKDTGSAFDPDCVAAAKACFGGEADVAILKAA